jgi:UrcA family protein
MKLFLAYPQAPGSQRLPAHTKLKEMTMNRMPTFRVVIATALIGAIASSFTVLPAVADSFDAAQITVKYGDVNLANSQGVATLYLRIQAAAKSVCWQVTGAEPIVHRKACVDEAILGAVSNVNNSALTAMYTEKTGKEMPSQVASVQH